MISFIGATANSKLRVTIVGKTTNVKLKTLSIAPAQTVIPHRHPTINSITEINPCRFASNSTSFSVS